MALERAEIVLPARGRFDLRATVLALGRETPPPYRWHEGTRPVLERPEELPDGSVHLLRIRPAPHGVVLEVTGRDVREIEVLAPLAARVRRALSLDVDLAGFHRTCRRDALLRPVARLGLGRVLRGTSVFEDVVRVLAWRTARREPTSRSIGWLVTVGRRCPARPALRAFPSPAALARISTQRLAAITGRGDRIAPIVRLSREVAAGRRDLEALPHLGVRDAARVLRSVRGIGPLGVARLLLLLGYLDEPVRDRDARAFARRALGGDGAALERWLRRQAPWRGLALWLAPWAADPATDGLLRSDRRPGVLASRAARRTGRGMPRSRARARRRRRPAR
jgi:3-methyladenine DNA glycosylase/8-oxoguanine DNA glycosylase